MKKIIVTGGLGFIGSNLINLLIKKNFFVINIDKISYSSSFYNTKEFKSLKNYKFIKCNIGEIKFKKILFKYKPICIFNLAAETHVDRSIDNPENFIQSNIVGVYNLLEYFKQYSKKFKTKLVHISTDEVYGDVIKGRTSEKYPYKPSSPYAASKAASDHLVSSYIRTYKIPAIITNCSNNYGPKQHPEKLIPKLIYNIINNRALPVYGKGKNSREWIYVKDYSRTSSTLSRVSTREAHSARPKSTRLDFRSKLDINILDDIEARSFRDGRPRFWSGPVVNQGQGFALRALPLVGK